MKLYQEKNFETAITEFKRYIFTSQSNPELANKCAEARFWCGMSYYRMKRYLRTVREFELVLSAYPESEIAPNAAFQIGKLYFITYTKNSLGYYYAEEEKDDDYADEEILVINPDDVIQALMYVQRNYPESSFVDDAYFLIGQLYEINKNYSQAREYYEKILDEFPESNKSHEAKRRLNELLFKRL